MKKIITLLCALVLIVSCTKQPYYEIPLDANGKVILTTISSTTTAGISSLDAGFTVTATLPNAKSGDVMHVELLQLQAVAGQATKQLLPMTGTQKDVTVGSDLKASVTYTRAEAMLTKVTDYVTVVYNGATDYAKVKVEMVAATTVSSPMASGSAVDIARTAEVAYFSVKVEPKEGAYTGDMVAKMKNGKHEPWVTMTGSPFSGAQPFMVPISGNDFAVGKDTMYFSFTASKGTYSEEITKTVIVRDPYFYLKKSATLVLGGGSAGRNLLINGGVAENAATANIAVLGTLQLQGGSVWLAAGHTIQFVPTDLAMYTKNNSNDAIAAFNAGVPVATVDPGAGAGIFVFKIVNGATAADVFYGMLKVTSVVPGVSVSFEYRIGDQYAHLLVIQ
jgi:hypothetical protein